MAKILRFAILVEVYREQLAGRHTLWSKIDYFPPEIVKGFTNNSSIDI